MNFVYNDGGRAAAGYKGQTGDCVTRSISIATGLSYEEIYSKINLIAEGERPRGNKKRSNARSGVKKYTYRKLLSDLGWEWTPTMTVGSGCKVHLKADELPAGTLIVAVSKHLTVVKDGVIYDTHDCSRNGTRCVYGYWSQP